MKVKERKQLIKLIVDCKFPDKTVPEGTVGELLTREKSRYLTEAEASEFPVSLDDFTPVILGGEERLLLEEEFKVLTN